ncbi:MAG: hypothetical protein HXX12_04975 [Geothrix sp.]|uniref:hypothetical protein n=1 Tax=Geothrix sp. TaxID=1962974 RepID=UPI0018216184|nr:hypothetical protein [Geothrix sp.]NWJ40309.1 hypothetical protein [Geothrix sp.]WIL21686.1 MAG: hypothetical protein QOZ81_000956 [Geothrix sp.]
MAIVIIESPSLTSDQKTRIGERVITALQHEGLAPGSVVVLFQPERGDIYLDGLLVKTEPAGLTPTQAPLPPKPIMAPPTPDPVPAFKAKARRSKPELQDLKTRLMKALQDKGSLSSFEAQVALDLKECDWAPATLRRLFTDLEEAQLIAKSGQKRGTRYVWKGIVSAPQTLPAVKLVKADTEEE